MTGRMIVCNIVDALSRTESLYHGLRLSLSAGGNRLPRLVFQFPAILCRSSSGEILHGFEFLQLWQFDAEHCSNILRVLARKASLALKSACLPPSLAGITAGVHRTLLRRPDAE